MRKSRIFLAFLILSVLFAATAAAYTLTGTFANENYAPPSEQIERYGGGKVEPPGWCVEHGYFGVQYDDCSYCGYID